MARSLFDWRRLDMPFSPAFFKWFWGSSIQDSVFSGYILPNDMALVDPDLAKHLRQMTELVNRRHLLCHQLALFNAQLVGGSNNSSNSNSSSNNNNHGNNRIINLNALTNYTLKHPQCAAKLEELRAAIVALDHEVEDLCLNFTLPGYDVCNFKF